MTNSRTVTLHSRYRAVGTLPVVCAVLVALNGLYVLLVAFGNITDYSANAAFVQHVLAMDTTNFGAPPEPVSIRGSCGGRSSTRPCRPPPTSG
jgi:hypothetical protein